MKPEDKRVQRGLWWDRAWSLVQGCTPVSESCEHCWAARQSYMWQNNPNKKIAERHAGLTETVKDSYELHDSVRFTGNVRCMFTFLDKPRSVKKPQVWSVWNDLFHEDVSDVFVLKALKTMEECERHLFLVLTKRIERARKFFDQFETAPKNMWLGTTIEHQDYVWRSAELAKIKIVAKRFLSLEPLLGPVKLSHDGSDILRCPSCGYSRMDMQLHGDHRLCKGPGPLIDWVIVGGESGANARPMHPDWVKSLVEHCRETATPIWFKQWGEWFPIRAMKSGDEYGDNEAVLNGDGQNVTGYEALVDEDFVSWLMRRVGKKKAGRLLDEAEILEWPEVEG